MNEDNDLLLRQFFSEAAQQTIADDGFTERVMRRLPDMQASQVRHQEKALWFSRLWTAFCIVVFAVLFVVLHGWELLAVQLEVMVRTLSVTTFTVNPLMLAAVLFGLLFVGVGEAISWGITRR